MDFSSTTVLPFAAMGAGALAVALSYTALLPGAGRSYRWWAAAYAATAARWIMITLAAAGVWSAGALLAQGLQIASALLLLGGTLVFLGRRPSPGAIAAGAALAAAWPIGALAFLRRAMARLATLPGGRSRPSRHRRGLCGGTAPAATACTAPSS